MPGQTHLTPMFFNFNHNKHKHDAISLPNVYGINTVERNVGPSVMVHFTSLFLTGSLYQCRADWHDPGGPYED